MPRVLLIGLGRWGRALAVRYTEQPAGLPVGVPEEADWAHSVYHLYVIRTARRDLLRAFLRERGIEAEALVGEILSLPIFPDLDEASVDTATEAIRTFFAG